MSTKSTVYRSDELHVYRDCMDNEPIRPLHVDYHSGGLSASVTLLPAALKAIHRSLEATLAFVREHATETDDSIERTCRAEVAERLGSAGLDALVGSLQYGDANDPQGVQIARGVKAAKEFRAQCRAAIEEWDSTEQREP